MIEAAAALPRKFGYNWWGEEKIKNEADKEKVCEEFFLKIDENGDGSVAFEEWLSFALDHYVAKSSELPPALDHLDRSRILIEDILTVLVFDSDNLLSEPCPCQKHLKVSL